MPVTRSRRLSKQGSLVIERVRREDAIRMNDEELQRYATVSCLHPRCLGPETQRSSYQRSNISTDLPRHEIIDKLFEDRAELPKLILERGLHDPVVESNVIQSNQITRAGPPRIEWKARNRSYNPHKARIASEGRLDVLLREAIPSTAGQSTPRPQSEAEPSTSQQHQGPRPSPLRRCPLEIIPLPTEDATPQTAVAQAPEGSVPLRCRLKII